MKDKLQKRFLVFIFFLTLYTLHFTLYTAVSEAGIFVISGSSRTFRSSDDTIWEEKTPLPAPGANTYQDICRDALGHLYVLRSDGYVYRSVDGGKSWTQQNTSPPATATNYDSIISSPVNAGVIYLMRVTGEVYRSINGGVIWNGPPPVGVLKSDNFIGLGIGRTSDADPSPRLFLIDDDGDTYYTNLALSDAWAQPPQKDVGLATDYTDLHGGYKGFLYVIDDDAPVVKSEDGATSPWVKLTNSPPGATNLYARIEQDWDILSSSEKNLYVLRTDGRGAKSLDGGVTAWSTWTITGLPANTFGLTSCDLIPPTTINYVTEGIKNSWYKTDPGAIYDVDFQDTNFGTVFSASYTINSLPLRAGTTLQPWTTVATNINASLYSANWGINFLACREATTNFVSVKVLDNGGNETTVNDVFYVLKDTTPPLAVTLNLPLPGTTVTYQNIFFSWDASTDTRSGVEDYLLQISTASNFSIINYSSSPVISQTTMTITEDKSYYWRVRAKDKAGNYSITWSTRSFTVNATVPSTPSNFQATAGGELVNLSWNSNPEGDLWKYEIYYSSYLPAADFLLTPIFPPGTTHQHTSLVSDNTYYYKIRAVDTAGNTSLFTSTGSAVPYDITPPAAVTNFTAIPGVNEGEIKLSWAMPGDDGMSGTIMNGQIKIQTSTVAGVSWSTAAAQITISTSAVTPGTTVSYTIGGLKPSATYYFYLWTADERLNWSTISNGATTWAQDLVPSTPTWITAISSDTIIALSWNANTEVDMSSYVIKCSSYSPTPEIYTSTTITLAHPTTFYLHTGLENEVTYYYKIKAVDKSNKESSYSTVVSTYPRDRIPPSAVTNLTAQPGSIEKTILLSWNYTGDNGNSGEITNGRYAIQYSTDSGVSWAINNAQINNSTSVTQGLFVSYTVTGSVSGLIEGTTYYFRLWTADEVPNWSGISNSTYSWAKRESPGNVGSFTCVAISSGNQIDFSWTASTSSDWSGTMIRWKDTSPAPTSPTDGNLLISVSTSVTTYSHTGLTDGTTYYYTAFAYDNAITPNYAGGVSTSTYPRDIVAPGQVTNFTVNDPGTGDKLELYWTNPGDTDFEATVIRYRTDDYPTSPTDGIYVSTVPKPGNSYIHTGLTAGTTYFYSAFTRDEVPNYSGPVTSSGYPTAVITPPTISAITPSTGEQGTIVTIDTITGTNFQSGATVVLKKIGYVDISTYTPFTVSYSTALTNGQFDLTVTTNAVVSFWTVRVTNPDGGYGELVDGFQIVDTSAPAAVSNLTASPGSAEKTITLTWNYTGDRGNTGPITDGYYAIKWASYTVTWSTTSANVIASTSVAQGAGASYTISNLIEGATYYIRLWLADEIPNWSEISNGATTWSQRQSPSEVSSFTALPVGEGEKINLSWANPTDTDFNGTRICASTITDPTIYETYFSTDLAKPVTYYLHTGLTDNVTYYYTAFAYDNAVTPNYAVGVSTRNYPRDALPPTNVTLFTSSAQPQGNTIHLSWSTTTITATDFEGVRVCSSTVNYPGPTDYNINIVTDVPKLTTYYIHINLTDNVTYYYRAWAYDEVRNYAIEVATTSTYPRDILPPTNVEVFVSSAQPQGNTIHLSWSTTTITATDFEGVRICSSTVGIPTDYNIGIVTDVPKGTTFYFDINLVDNLTYYYRAWAYDEVRNYGIEVAITSACPRDMIPPARVLDLSTGTVNGTSIELRWTAPGDNENSPGSFNGAYWIKGTTYTTITDTNWETIISTVNIQWSTTTAQGAKEGKAMTNLRTDTTYYFALRTRDEVPNQWSYVSNCATGTTRDVTPPAKVTNLSAESGVSAGSVRLTWTAPGDDLAIGTATIYAIKYSPTLPFDWNTALTWRADRPVGGGAGYPEEEIVTSLTPGTSYYFYLKTADEVPNWSDLSNGATGYATAVVAALTLYKTTTYTDTPFTADSSCKLSTTPMTTSNLDTFANTGKNVGYMQFRPLVTNTSFESLPTATTQYGWLYQAEQEFKTLFSGKWSMKIGWQSTSADGRGYLWYRISKVSATVSGTIEWRETLLPWTVSSILGGNDVLNHTTLDTPTVSSTTFAKGELLFIEFFIQQSVAQRTPGDGWRFQVNTASNYVITSDIRDITPPAEITNFYAVTSSTKGMVDLSWTAVGNNDLLGQATYYDIRRVTDPAFDWSANWSLATIWKDRRPTGGPAGTSETETVTGLTPGTTYYFRLRTYDDATPVANWSLSNRAIAWVYVATHTVNVYNTAPIHKRMNNSKRDDLLKITISNARTPGYGAIYLSTVTVRFTRDGLTALTTAEAKNLFQNIYLYADDQQDGFYHYSQDITTVARVTNTNISLTDGSQIITTLDGLARRLNPQEIKNYFLVVELSSTASAQTPSTFTATISGLGEIKIIDENTGNEDTTLGTITNFPLVSYSVSAIEPATKRPGTNWPFNIGAKVQSIPLVYWDRVYIGADNGNFYCLDSSGNPTISPIWTFSTDGNSAINTAPFPGYNEEETKHTLYFTDIGGRVYKIRDAGSSASLEWKRTDVNASTGSWIGYDYNVQNIFVGSIDGKVYKLNFSTGGNGENWAFDASVTGSLTSTPAVDDYTGVNGLWIGSAGGTIYRLNLANGTVTSSFATDEAIQSSPNLVAGYSVDVGGTGNNLYFASTNGKLYCRTASNLTSTPSGWSDFNASSPIYSNPYFTPYEGGQYVYFGADNGKLYKVNASNGGLVWSYQTDGKIRSTPMSDGTYVYFTSDDGYIYCLTTGGSLRDKWPVHTGAPVRSSPSIDIDNKTLTIGSDDKNVYQFYIGD